MVVDQIIEISCWTEIGKKIMTQSVFDNSNLSDYFVNAFTILTICVSLTNYDL